MRRRLGVTGLGSDMSKLSQRHQEGRGHPILGAGSDEPKGIILTGKYPINFAEGKSLILDRSVFVPVREAEPYQTKCTFPWVGAILANPWLSALWSGLFGQRLNHWGTITVGSQSNACRWSRRLLACSSADSCLHRKTVEQFLRRLAAKPDGLRPGEEGWSVRGFSTRTVFQTRGAFWVFWNINKYCSFKSTLYTC